MTILKLRWLLTISLFALAPPLAGATAWGPFESVLLVAPGEVDKDTQSFRSAFESVGMTVQNLTPDQLSSSYTTGHLLLVVPRQSAAILTESQVVSICELTRGGMILVTDGESPLAGALGIHFDNSSTEQVSGEQNQLFPTVAITWEQPASMKRFIVPPGAAIHDTTRPGNRPLLVSFPVGKGRCFFLGIELDPVTGDGYARFPYFLHVLLSQSNIQLPFRNPRLEALFDYGFRTDVDLDYFARKWRQFGISALHVGAWHFYDRERDDYLRALITACHRNGILVYAWLELPEVSHEFWVKHPEWREKNGLLQDAPALWRENMNLLNPDCFREVMAGVLKLLHDFDWDGINLCEVYYEGPDGPHKPFEFTPMNNLVREDFRRQTGFDPAAFFQPGAGNWQTNPLWKRFVDYRAGLILHLHEDVLKDLDLIRKDRPYLDVLVTEIDNFYQPEMKEASGVDMEGLIRLMPKYNFGLVVEDPNRIWNLAPSRYQGIGKMYSARVQDSSRLGIDLNIVSRPGVAYPTAQQTGIEMLQIFHYAATNFHRTVLYIESSIFTQDFPFITRAMANPLRSEVQGDRLTVSAAEPLLVNIGEIPMVTVDGRPSPFIYAGEVFIPPGTHEIRPYGSGSSLSKLRVHRLNATLQSGELTREGLRFSYSSGTRAIAILNAKPASMVVDGRPYSASMLHEGYGEYALTLPPGSHEVALREHSGKVESPPVRPSR